MNNDSQIITSSQMISKVVDFSGLGGNELSSVWQKVVSKIGKKEDENDTEVVTLGERLAENSRVVDLKNGVLLVETNHSGWIQYLRMYQKFILNGIKWSLPDLKISSLGFRIRGSEASLSEVYDSQIRKSNQKMNEKIEKQQEELDKRFSSKKEDGKSKLPPELLEKLENMKKDMLTNSKI